MIDGYIYIINGLAVFFTGCLLGSFLNVVIYRMPEEKSIAYPSSRCPKCNNNISWYDNVPIFSWLLLGAKCRYCKDKISVRYPFVEFLTGCLFFLCFYTFGIDWKWIFISYFICLMVVITLIDIDNMIVLPAIIYPSIFVGVLYNFIKGDIIQSLLASFLGFIIFYIIEKISLLVLKKEGMGRGDALIACLLGSWLGVNSMINSVMMSFFIGSFIGFILLVKNNFKSKQFPFGPSLALSSLITLFSNENYVFDWYIGNFM